MRNLLALMALSMFVLHANAVTPSKSSTIDKAKQRDQALAQELALEVEAEERQSAPATQNAVTAVPAAAPKVSRDEQVIESELAQAEAQQSVTYIEPKKQSKTNNMYIMGAMGSIIYPSVTQVSGKYAGTIGFGYMLNPSIMLEAGGSLAKFNMNPWSSRLFNVSDQYEVDQYSLYLAAKYKMEFGRIAPNLGLLVAMTNRSLTLRDPNNVGNNSMTVDRGSTQSTDGGVTAGVDFELDREYAIGFDVKYLFNISADQNSAVYNFSSSNLNTIPNTYIEKLENVSLGVSARMNF